MLRAIPMMGHSPRGPGVLPGKVGEPDRIAVSTDTGLRVRRSADEIPLNNSPVATAAMLCLRPRHT